MEQQAGGTWMSQEHGHNILPAPCDPVWDIRSSTPRPTGFSLAQDQLKLMEPTWAFVSASVARVSLQWADTEAD